MSTAASLTLYYLPSTYAICRIDPLRPIPPWAYEGPFHVIVRTPQELSIVCDARFVPPDVRADVDWRALVVDGPLPLDQIGVLNSVASPLTVAGIGIFVVSTYDTDYILVRAGALDSATAALRRAGHNVCDDGPHGWS